MSIQQVLDAIETQLDEIADEIAVLEQERDRLYAARAALVDPKASARRDTVKPPPTPKPKTTPAASAKVKSVGEHVCPECKFTAGTAAALGSHRSRLHGVAGRTQRDAQAAVDALADLEREVLGDA